MIGKIINQYEFLEELGKGGMGIVYKARDVRLNRYVAIKVLPSEKNLPEDRRKRFVHEARSASALNHPNIVSIYEIDRHNGIDYIVMEFVDGSTLADLIPRRGLRLNEILRYAVQIGDALAAAHAAGIIHRDLKPGNVMVTRQGRVKVLDFGLAKLVDNPALLNESQDTLSAEFRDAYITADRHVVGTASYMSPEQAEGRPVDPRSDIFSFGVVLYEMLSGQRAFQAVSAAATMASVLRDEPKPISEIAPATPAELQRIVQRCLRKDPQRRIQHMDDLTLVLDDLKQQSDSGTLAAASTAAPLAESKVSSRHAWWLVPVILAAALLGWFAGTLGRGADPVSKGSTSLARFAGGGREAVSPAWSPDGQWVAYASDADGTMDIWKKPTRGGEAVAVTGAPHDEHSPAWSPDGRSIAYSSNADGGGIFHIPENGGSPARLATFGANPKWAPDGKSITFDWNGDIYVVPVPAVGREPRLVVVGTGSTPYTAWSPDGRRLAFWHETKVDLFTVTVDGGVLEPLGLVPTGEEVSGLSWSADGEWLVYSQGAFGGNKDLWRVSIDAATGLSSGAPERLTLSATDDSECAISPDGKRIAYDVRRLERHLWQFDRNPATGLAAGRAKRISENGQLNYYPAASPDGRLVAWTSHASGLGQLYYKDVSKGKTIKVTGDWLASNREIFASFSAEGEQMLFTSTLNGSYQIWQLPSLGSVSLQISHAREPARDVAPVLSPDGSLIAFYGNLSGNWDIWLMEPGNGAEPRQLTDWPGNETYPVFSPDGSELAFLADKEGTPDIWLYDLKSGEFRSYVNGPAQEGWCAWSPDGRFLYFSSNRRGEFEVWMMPVGGGEAQPVALPAAAGERLPQAKLLTKFAVTGSSLIVPLESRRSEIYMLSLGED